MAATPMRHWHSSAWLEGVIGCPQIALNENGDHLPVGKNLLFVSNKKEASIWD